MDSQRLLSLPTELLLQIFNNLTTKELLPLTTVSHRVHDITISIIETRLDQADRLYNHGYKLILMSCDPAHLTTEPYMLCTPRGKEEVETSGPGTNGACPDHHLGQLRSRYSRFRLRRKGPEDHRRAARPGDIPGSRTHPLTAEPAFTDGGQPGEGLIHQRWSFDGVFFQLCVNLRFVNKQDHSTGKVQATVVRIFWEWLRASAGMSHPEVEHFQSMFFKDTGPGIGEDDRILWFSGDRDVGLRLRVGPHRLTEEERSFDVDYEGELRARPPGGRCRSQGWYYSKR